MVCAAMGLCVSQQEALAQLMSNEIPTVDLTQRINPFLLNIPQLLYPQENTKETPKQVKLSNLYVLMGGGGNHGDSNVKHDECYYGQVSNYVCVSDLKCA